MKPLVELLKRCAENHTFDSGDPDCKTVLDQLYRTYAESHENDPPGIRSGTMTREQFDAFAEDSAIGDLQMQSDTSWLTKLVQEEQSRLIQ